MYLYMLVLVPFINAVWNRNNGSEFESGTSNSGQIFEDRKWRIDGGRPSATFACVGYEYLLMPLIPVGTLSIALVLRKGDIKMGIGFQHCHESGPVHSSWAW